MRTINYVVGGRGASKTNLVIERTPLLYLAIEKIANGVCTMTLHRWCNHIMHKPSDWVHAHSTEVLITPITQEQYLEAFPDDTWLFEDED